MDFFIFQIWTKPVVILRENFQNMHCLISKQNKIRWQGCASWFLSELVAWVVYVAPCRIKCNVTVFVPLFATLCPSEGVTGIHTCHMNWKFSILWFYVLQNRKPQCRLILKDKIYFKTVYIYTRNTICKQYNILFNVLFDIYCFIKEN
jgi:hypothetical protein